MSVLAPILDQTPVDSIDAVLERMRQIDEALPPGDGVSCFNHLYLAVTVNVLAAKEQQRFADPPFLADLDVAFANLYFAALRAFDSGDEDTPRAWLPLLAARARTDVAPLQFALAGMNAHINRDLPQALVETFAALGVDMTRPSRQSDDYDRVDALLAATEAGIKDSYLGPLARRLDRRFAGVDDAVANWSVSAARRAAWTNGWALWHLRAHATLSTDYLDTLDGMVGFAGRGLLVPTGVAGLSG